MRSHTIVLSKNRNAQCHRLVTAVTACCHCRDKPMALKITTQGVYQDNYNVEAVICK